MEKLKHSPAPWIAEPRVIDLELTIFSADNKRICDVKSFIGPEFRDPTKEQADANAQLIAAAPELLSELLDLIEYLGEDWQNDTQVLKAKAVINKLTF